MNKTSGPDKLSFPRPSRENACAVIAAYCPGPSLERLVQRCGRVFGLTIVVDNTPCGQTGAASGLFRRTPGLCLIRLGANQGQARALNIGFERAARLGYDWAACFDQDSLPDQDYLQAMAEVMPETSRILPAVIGCNYRSSIESKERIAFDPDNGAGAVPVKTVITSGGLHHLGLFQRLGRFREEFFIDHVDHDYCLRARRAGWAVLRTRRVLLDHSIGRISLRRVLGKTLQTSNHSPGRRYCQHRNGIRLVLENLAREPGWCLTIALYHMPVQMAAMLLFEKDRGRKLGAAVKGLWHGLRRDFSREVRP